MSDLVFIVGLLAVLAGILAFRLVDIISGINQEIDPPEDDE